MKGFQPLRWIRVAWFLLFCWTVECALSPSGTYQGCQGCCSGTFTDSGKCSGGFSCPAADTCCYKYTYLQGGSGSGCSLTCASGKYCCSWADPTITSSGGSGWSWGSVVRTQDCLSQCNIPPPSSFEGSVSGGSNYWTGCDSSNSGTIAMSGAAVGELWDGVYSSVSMQGATVLTVIGSATLSSLYMQSNEATATIQGTVTNIYTTTFSPSIVITVAQLVPSITSGAGTPTILGTGTVTTFSMSGGGGVNLRAPAIISTLMGAGAVMVAGTVTLASISGATTVSSGGMIATLTQSGGSISISLGGSVTTLSITGSLAASIGGRVDRMLSVVSSGVTISILAGGSVQSISGSGVAPSIASSGSVVYASSGGTTTVNNGGSIATLVQSGGSVSVDSGGTVTTLSGYGSFTVGGAVTSMTTTTSSTTVTVTGIVSTLALSASTAVTVAISGTIATVTGAAMSPTIIVDGTIGMFSAAGGLPTFSGTGQITFYQQTNGSSQFASGLSIGTVSGYGSFALAVSVTSVTFTGASIATVSGVVGSILVLAPGVTIAIGAAGSAQIIGSDNMYGFDLSVNNVAGTVANRDGGTTVFSGGTITALTQSGGTCTVRAGGTVGTIIGTGTFSLNGAVTSVTTTATGATITVGTTGTVINIQGNAAPSIYVYRMVGSIFNDGGATTVYAGGVVSDTLTQHGGTCTIIDGGVATAIVGFGQFAVAGSAASIVITAQSTLFVYGTITGAILVSLCGAGTTITTSGYAENITSEASTAITAGGTVRTLAQSGGGSCTVLSGGLVGNVTGYGTFVVKGNVSNISTSAVGSSIITVDTTGYVDFIDGASTPTTVNVYHVVGSAVNAGGNTAVYASGVVRMTLTQNGGICNVSTGGTVDISVRLFSVATFAPLQLLQQQRLRSFLF